MKTKQLHRIILPLMLLALAGMACALPQLTSQADFELAVQETLDASVCEDAGDDIRPSLKATHRRAVIRRRLARRVPSTPDSEQSRE